MVTVEVILWLILLSWPVIAMLVVLITSIVRVTIRYEQLKQENEKESKPKTESQPQYELETLMNKVKMGRSLSSQEYQALIRLKGTTDTSEWGIP